MTDTHPPMLMVVDDNDEIQQTLKTFFKGVGCDVLGMYTAEEAWAALTSGKIAVDVLILDWDLPLGMSGPQLNKKIKNHDGLKDIPVIFYTANWNPNQMSPTFMEWLSSASSREGDKDSVFDKKKAQNTSSSSVPHPGLLLNVAQKLEENRKPVPEELAKAVKLLRLEGFDATDEVLRMGQT
jgi:CheY-like chemotaxis protein